MNQDRSNRQQDESLFAGNLMVDRMKIENYRNKKKKKKKIVINVKVRKNGKKNRKLAAVELDKASMAYLPVNQVFFNCIFQLKNIQKWMN